MRALRLCCLLWAACGALYAQDLKAFEKKVTEFTLPNGLHFIVVERHEAPVVSFHTYVNSGSVDDPSGETGMAHMFEHMAFKGTDTIGTKDFAAEKKALDVIDDLSDRIDEERNKGPKANASKIEELERDRTAAISNAETFVVPNDFGRIIEENGGSGLNADTSFDYTEYYYSLPSNRIELWFLLESQRFLHPVFREFYKERDVVMEEERMRIESNPQGRLIQQFLSVAFEAHPYRNPGVGWPSDIANLRRRDAELFFAQHYVPANVTMGIVGDVDPAEARRLAEKYFSPWAAKPLPPRVHTVEPPQAGNRTVVVDSPSQPMLLLGYHRPDQYDPDDAVFDILQLVLSSGRTSILYKDLVQDKKLAVNAAAASTFPDGRYPNEFIFFIVPAVNHTVDENQKALDDVLTKFEATRIDDEALNRAKAKARSYVIRQLADNAGLANLMTAYYATYGDWRKLFTSIDEINKVTAADVQRVALKYLAGKPRTLAYIRTQAPVQAPRGVRR